MRQVPILFLSDSPSDKTGLARITRDLCALLSRSPKFRVGSLGLGSSPSRTLPWMQYNIDARKGIWGWDDLPTVWRDFAGTERGVVMTIWDLTRIHWLARPQFCGNPKLEAWLRERHFDLWGYLPIDASGPGGKLSSLAADACLGFDRLLCYTKWAKNLVENTIGAGKDLDWLPHGLSFERWGQIPKPTAKSYVYPRIEADQKLIGVIGTNQVRKDWGLMAQVCRMIAEQRKDVRFWWHSDVVERHWNFDALLEDYGLRSLVYLTYDLKHEQLRIMYNACDLTLHPGLGEGFGYPIFESLACGTPVIHGDYAGGADVLYQSGHGSSLIRPVAWRSEGIHNQIRPVYEPTDWASEALEALAEEPSEDLRMSISHLDWRNLWPSFERWFEQGLR